MGPAVEFYQDLPLGRKYYMDLRYYEDRKATPHTKGRGADDRARRQNNENPPVIVAELHDYTKEQDGTP